MLLRESLDAATRGTEVGFDSMRGLKNLAPTLPTRYASGHRPRPEDS